MASLCQHTLLKSIFYLVCYLVLYDSHMWMAHYVTSSSSLLLQRIPIEAYLLFLFLLCALKDGNKAQRCEMISLLL